MDLTGKVILLTGAARGIGVAIAEKLHRSNAEVVLHYSQSQTEAEHLIQKLGADRCHQVQADLSVPGAGNELWQGAIAWKCRIDVLVNNAATMPYAAVNAPLEQWHQVWQNTLQVNLLTVADLCREAILHYQTRPEGGIIINIASRAAFRGDAPDFMNYAASKGGVVSLTRSIARGFAHQNILAYTIAPGFVRTERIEELMQERGAEYVTRDIPLGEPVPPPEVAEAVAFLASGAVRHMTGSTLDINGASYVR